MNYLITSHTKSIWLWMLLVILPFSGKTQSKQRTSVPADISRWITTTFAKGKTPPFSFVYDGKTSAELLRHWKYTLEKEKNDDPQVVKYCITYQDPVTGLQAKCHVTGYNAFHAVEWVMHFTNTSSKNSATLEQVKVVDYTLESTQESPFILHHAKGSHFERGIQDFQPCSTPLAGDTTLHFVPEGGRSSDNTAFPFYNLETPDQSGVMVAIGWTGNWFAEFAKRGKKETSLSAGIERMQLYLYPGESVRTPLVSLLFWQGENRMIGHNCFRRFILAHHSPRIHGELVTQLLSASFSADGNAQPCSAPNSCLTQAQALAVVDRFQYYGMKPEIFWLDAGWATGTGYPNNYVNGAGNQSVDTIRFPNTLKPIAEAVHKAGAKFMVWFEPERVYQGSWLDREHPEWLLKFPNNPSSLLDLGNPEALNWLCHQIGDLMEENGIDYYRQDCNIHLSPYWQAYDTPGRVGIKEIRHVEGLYAFWDYLLERFPNLLIDNCAGGGRRLDLETTSRSIPLWRTDFESNPEGSQCHTYGLNFYLPQHGTGTVSPTDYELLSYLSSTLVLNWEVFGRKNSIPEMQRLMETYKQLRPYFYEDYYPLTGTGDLTGNDVWLAYQLHRPSDNSGIVVAFRRKDNTQNTINVSLQGLDSERTYNLQNETSGTLLTQTGAELARGVTLSIDQTPGALLLQYHIVP